ncbi:hypothetical protein ACP6OW_003592 [Cronobacter turicensis]|uniref:hypothetical protein n=1 Tax=Cronobacter turicensis TaxID=413502 RepID=UPI000CFD55C4|nr:hypothetical protein [Cronobacter turicensis]EKM5762004.1 hypothetical protein [Cronobacter turicensis]ELQ6107209.1 hypothetical protein [Cronobacter turicensis]ELY3836091.1 hypothetical protein [Cronobacter turicensis]
MKFLKLSLFAAIGAVCGAALMLLILPVVCRVVVGPIQGEDQMSQNFLIFLVGTPLMAVAGALAGWFLGTKVIQKH